LVNFDDENKSRIIEYRDQKIGDNASNNLFRIKYGGSSIANGIALNDAQIRGLITAAALREHDVASTVAVASHGGVYRSVKATDKPTPAAAKYKALETLWSPVLKTVYTSPAAAGLRGVLEDPRVGTTRILKP
jgi:hypothetical protein